jgi:hypothetical protein
MFSCAKLYGKPSTTQLLLLHHVAGSAVIEELGADVVSAADLLQLLGDRSSAKGLTDGGTHNALLVLAAPQDSLATAVLKVASGTQVRNGMLLWVMVLQCCVQMALCIACFRPHGACKWQCLQTHSTAAALACAAPAFAHSSSFVNQPMLAICVTLFACCRCWTT